MKLSLSTSKTTLKESCEYYPGSVARQHQRDQKALRLKLKSDDLHCSLAKILQGSRKEDGQPYQGWCVSSLDPGSRCPEPFMWASRSVFWAVQGCFQCQRWESTFETPAYFWHAPIPSPNPPCLIPCPQVMCLQIFIRKEDELKNVIVMPIEGRIAILVNIFPCESESYEPDKQRRN